MLLEREEQLGLMAGVLAEIGSSGGKVVLIRGEAGVGKSALVREFLETHGAGAHIYFGSCDDLLTLQPLGPFWDIALEDSSLSESLGKGDRRAVMEALLNLLSPDRRATILVVEDVHWADEATFDVIKYLGRRISGSKGLLLLTYRDGEVDHDHPLRQVIGGLAPQDLVRIHLGGLSAEAVALMVEHTNLDSGEVFSLTDGNPLFVIEVAVSGVEGVPSSVQDSVLARAGKLSSGARRLLDLVSVIPGQSKRSFVETIVKPTNEEITECVRQGLLRLSGDTVSFHHELSRRSVESALNAADRRRLNQMVLDELGESADPSRLVHHAREANDVASIIEFAPKAARAAMALGSHREAVGHFRTIEPYLDQIAEADRGAIVDDWAKAESYAGTVGSLDVLDRAIALHRSTGDERALARALTFAIRANESIGRPRAADACAAEAVAILETYSPGRDLAYTLSQQAWISMMRDDGLGAIALADQAISLAEAAGEELVVIHSLNTKGCATYIGGDSDGRSLLEEARSRAELAGDPYEETRALYNLASAAAAQRELKLASHVAQQAIATAVRYELRSLENVSRAFYAEILLWKGEWAVAEDLSTELLRNAPRENILSKLVAGRVLGRLQARRGIRGARDTLDRSWSSTELNAETQNLLPAAAALAEYMWLTGERDPDRITRFREVLEKGISVGNAWISGELAFWLWKLGELKEAPDGIAKPYRLVIEGRPTEAATAWESIGVPYDRAWALMHGEDDARLEALEQFETMGATAVAAKLRQKLRTEGVSVPRGRSQTTRDHAAGLTARQAEILGLLGEALTNIEIADRLFVSPRTVEHHVAAVMSKLNASSRDEAVAKAVDQGLLSV